MRAQVARDGATLSADEHPVENFRSGTSGRELRSGTSGRSGDEHGVTTRSIPRCLPQSIIRDPVYIVYSAQRLCYDVSCVCLFVCLRIYFAMER